MPAVPRVGMPEGNKGVVSKVNVPPINHRLGRLIGYCANDVLGLHPMIVTHSDTLVGIHLGSAT